MQARSQTAPNQSPNQAKGALTQPNAPGVSNLPNVNAASEEVSRRSAYGLPCAKCGMYYEAALPACPICKSPERVAPRAIKPQTGVLTSPTQSLPPIALGTLESIPDAAALEEERERFLRELKTQLDAGLAARSSDDASTCARQSVHTPGSENGIAEVCRDCYDQAQDSADRMEAALHMDPKDAAQIIYDAVWADTSDPEQTYVNAANALLHELRTRSGLPSTPGIPGKYSH
jgi:hypothetical protein